VSLIPSRQWRDSDASSTDDGRGFDALANGKEGTPPVFGEMRHARRADTPLSRRVVYSILALLHLGSERDLRVQAGTSPLIPRLPSPPRACPSPRFVRASHPIVLVPPADPDVTLIAIRHSQGWRQKWQDLGHPFSKEGMKGGKLGSFPARHGFVKQAGGDEY
jgi:hypothetical protein